MEGVNRSENVIGHKKPNCEPKPNRLCVCNPPALLVTIRIHTCSSDTISSNIVKNQSVIHDGG